MKRATNSQEALPLKRRASSMFSISTVVENDEAVEEEVAVAVALLVEQHGPYCAVADTDSKDSPLSESPALTPPPRMSTMEDSSSGSEDEGLFFDEDSQGEDKDAPPVVSSYIPSISIPSTPAVQEALINDTESITCMPLGDLRTGIVAESGSKHFDRHNRLHKERPLRITSIMESLESSQDDLSARCCILDDAALGSTTDFLQDDGDYLRVHLPGYMQRLNTLNGCTCCERLDHEAEQYKSIFLTADSVAEAKKAAASLCNLVTRVVHGDLDNGFAVIRPPGHHAEPALAGGYCLINNVAVATAYARAVLHVQKVLIVDWDVHHGNGTQNAFLNDPNVLYFSVHRWQGGKFFPFLPTGGPTTVGKDDGKGFNVNVGWSQKGMGDEEYCAVWERLLMPMAQEFQPDLVLVSAGFDAADGDLGECTVSAECFGHLTRSLMSLANGRVVCALEGGYVRRILGACVKSVVSILLNPKSPTEYTRIEREAEKERGGADILDTIHPSAAKDIHATIAAHRPYWKFLRE